ncbi:calmodulin [Thecamonas trahens ATCC 50062]|uniref:Calmodulin n=1 Tax=Thecamonas trahens ATCC 50062 TaxID=461836 RepID=A0A0L0D2Y4_THETB|nr:calmodulin [Thecamonas trahens ATCC 50062]KNC46687.1 calmodulin [Thecamonas trahens ATCC 50062]|eukprot:XP_013760455.1 calmodulin [Thecamonas trahens ATCC 50062]
MSSRRSSNASGKSGKSGRSGLLSPSVVGGASGMGSRSSFGGSQSAASSLAMALTDDQLAQFEDAFSLMADAKSNVITHDGLASVFDMLGLGANDDDIENMLNEVEPSGSQQLSFDQFLTIMSRSLEDKSSDDILYASFQVFDVDDSGTINLQEFRGVLEMLGQQLTDEEYIQIIRGADTDADGTIDFEEYKQMLSQG